MTHHDAERAAEMSPLYPGRWLVSLAAWSCLLLSASCLSTLHHTLPDESPEESNKYVLVSRGVTLHHAPSAEAAVATIPFPENSKDPCQLWPIAFRLVQHRGEWTEIESLQYDERDLHPHQLLLDDQDFRVRFWVERDSLTPVSSYTRTVLNSDGSGFVIRAGVAFPRHCGFTYMQSQFTQLGLDVDQPMGWVGESYSPTPVDEQPDSSPSTERTGSYAIRVPVFNGYGGDVIDERGDLSLFRVKKDWGEARIWIPTSRFEYRKSYVIDFSGVDLSNTSPPQQCFVPTTLPWSRSRPDNSVLYWPSGEPAGTVGDIPFPRQRVDPRSLKCGTVELDGYSERRDSNSLLLCQPE